MSQFNGIVYHSDDASQTNCVYLPLEEVQVKIIVLDVSARVTLKQVYANDSEQSTSRAKYVFPIPASAAICAFEMCTEDGRTVTGVAKDSKKAQEDFNAAVHAGKQAALLELATDDIFTISVGAIPPKQKVETKLVYVMSLANESVDEVRLQIPSHVGIRYGPAPAALALAASPSARTRVRISVDIQTHGRLQSITSPSHAILQRPYSTHVGRDSRRRVKVTYRSPSFLGRDFVLLVRAEDLDAPRCFAELSREKEAGNPVTLAMQLVIVPKFGLPPVAVQEYLFLVDRSGSMSGIPMETTKRTLAMLFRMLPTRGTTFNVLSFGNSVDALWSHSVPYGQNSLLAATVHVEQMNANYGGTEIRAALQFAFQSRNSQTATALFVLTDGNAYDIDATVAVVESAVKAAPATAPIRVFALGIGNSVSSAMCEGISRAGNGVCTFAVTPESIVSKCARLLRAGRTPFVENVSIDWGVSQSDLAEVSTVVFSPADNASHTLLRPPPAIQQSPPQIHEIHAGVRMNVYVILALKAPLSPKEVTLNGRLDGGGEPFSMTIPIRGVQLKGADIGVPLVHTLAASHLINDLEERRTSPPLAGGPAVTQDLRREAAIIRLGERYQLASSCTSFLAIDDNKRLDTVQSKLLNPSDGQHSIGRSLLSWIPVQTGWLRSLVSSFPVSSPVHASTIPGAWPGPIFSSGLSGNEPEAEYDSDATFSTLSSFLGSYEGSSPPPTPPPEITEEEANRQRSPSPNIRQVPLSPQAHPAAQQQTPPTVDPSVTELVRLQRFDGAFVLDRSLEMVVGSAAVRKGAALQVDDTLWATILAVAFFQVRMASSQQKELLDDLLYKSREFLTASGTGVTRINALLAQARVLVVPQS